jgi:hypothetical protein
MSIKAKKEEQPGWYYLMMAINSLAILFAIGMLRDLMWIY